MSATLTERKDGSGKRNRRGRNRLRHAYRGVVALLVPILVLAGCASEPLQPYSTDGTPLMLVPAIQHAGQDRRGRFQEILCAVLEARKETIPDYRSCEDVISPFGTMPEGSGAAVNLGPARHPLKLVFVPGLGWDCVSSWLAIQETVATHLRQFGYDAVRVEIDGLADSRINAEAIRDAVMALPREQAEPDLVLVGYSKGAVDALEAVVSHPEILPRLAAVVSLAGVVGGTPLANDVSDREIGMLRLFPGATCQAAGHGALQDLRPLTRQAWLAANKLPSDVPYYSLITFPAPERISALLQSSYRTLSQVDARNDGQVLFYDQFIPNSSLLAYLNADHWAVAVPIARTHEVIADMLVEHNAFPREAVSEALLRIIDEDLASAAGSVEAR